jgi:hypothetical protein
LFAGAALVKGAESPGFNRDIRPLLAKHCLACHGPDAAKRKGDLRLDDRDAAVDTGAIVPGKAEDSELWRRLTSTDPDEVMPPPGKGESIPAAGIEAIRQWIDSGAKYERHWAFLAPHQPTIPSADELADFPIRSPLDALVLESLKKRGQSPAPPAARERWIRRVAIDLTGLPPTPEEIAAFLADQSEGAYEAVVDRLLGSAAYGERMAVEWLDAARYGDTYGRHEDQDCVAWPWRDWVIRSINENMPYDQFVTRQLAGDLLPGATRDDRIATAFNRLHVMTNEAGSNPEEFRCEGVADRVKTTGAVLMGLTLECARCHDHKYDPVTMRDFYGMWAFFDNIDEMGAFTNLAKGVPGPSMAIFPDGGEEKHAALRKKIAEKEAARDASLPDADARYAVWLKANRPPEIAPKKPAGWSKLWSWAVTPRVPAGWTAPTDSYSFDDFEDRRKFANVVNPEHPAMAARNARKSKGFDGGVALNFPVPYTVELKGAGAFSRTDAFSIGVWVKLEESLDEGVVIHRTRGAWDAGNRGYEITIENDRPVARLSYFWPGNAIGVRASEPIPIGEWTHLAMAYDGSSRAAGLKLYVNGSAEGTEVVADHLSRDFRYHPEWGDFDEEQVPDSKMVAHPELTLAGRFLGKLFLNGSIDQVEVYDRQLSGPEVARLAGMKREFSEKDWLPWYLRELDEPWRIATAELNELRHAEDALVKDAVELMIMRERESKRPTHLLARGAFDQPKEVVPPGVPASVLPYSADLPPNRLGLARWLFDPAHPLTARVQMNRLWQLFFGTGIVATTEDFGIQGELPSHPELLDWLALHFRDSGWDVKAMCRMIALSSTYRQDSLPRDAALLASDPDNRWLARGPRLRLSAEQLRDQALSVAGLLSQKSGGPSVRPYQPEGFWEEGGTQHVYIKEQGEGLFRRSLYTFWRRTMPPPSLQVFDAPSREFCVVRRPRTSNPLQALTLLNDPLYVEAACLTAERLVSRHPKPENDADRCREAFAQLTGRQPDARQLEALTGLLADTRARFSSDPASASAFRDSAGDGPVNTALSSVEVAATAAVVRALLSYDEVTHKL